MSSCKAKVGLVLGLLFMALPACSQVKFGSDVVMTMSGDLGFGYSGAYGDTEGSSHGVGLSGDASLNGYYYNPRFLNFHGMGVYNRSQANSESSSLTQASDYSTGVNFLSGSHFPASISWSQGFNTSSTYGVLGVPGINAHGDSRSLGLAWAEAVPGLPSVTVQYSQQHSTTSVFGTTGDDQSTSRNLSIGSLYNWRGWMMSGRFTDNKTAVQLPAFLTSGTATESETGSTTYSFNTNHKIPLHGSLALNVSHSDFSGDSGGSSVSGSNTEYTATATLNPTLKTSSSFGVEYNSDLSGLLEQQLVNAGSVTPAIHTESGGHSLSMYNSDSIVIYKGLGAGFGANWTEQQVGGQTVTSAHWGGTVNYHYMKPLWGSIFLYAGANDQVTDSVNQGAGFVGGANLSRKLWGFDASASVAYSQDVQTLLAVATVSSYSYSASLRKRFSRKMSWNGSFNGFHSGLTQVAGQSDHSESYQSSVLIRGLNLGANYTRSAGTALVTSSGLVTAPVSVLPVLTGISTMRANASGYGFNAGINPVRKLSLSAAYSRTNTSSTTSVQSSSAVSSSLAFFGTYQVRKLAINGGYIRATQGVTLGGVFSPPSMYATYSVGIQRWFNFF